MVRPSYRILYSPLTCSIYSAPGTHYRISWMSVSLNPSSHLLELTKVVTTTYRPLFSQQHYRFRFRGFAETLMGPQPDSPTHRRPEQTLRESFLPSEFYPDILSGA